jgi:3-deoxy-manno-octulosonate cytidylyltransferase (CMP-KDO synthetase)
MKKLAIIIPARYGSSRFEGKPLTLIAGKSMLQWVFEIAQKATVNIENTEIVIATEDERIKTHALEIGAKVFMTPRDCKTGSDRVLAACDQFDVTPDIVLNLQGDAPLTPPSFVQAIAQELIGNDSSDVVTPVVQLTWAALDKLKENKKTTPFSGTTAIVGNDDTALWFSKQIIPAIRKEDELRNLSNFSPVLKHVGLYGFRYDALKKFVALPEGKYEQLEALEQLRMLESGMSIKVVKVNYGDIPQIGVDTREDAKRAEDVIVKYGL